MGSLGADVLSRFGAVKIDFRKETLTLGAEEEGPTIHARSRTRRRSQASSSRENRS